MEKKTPLYDVHVKEGGKIVPFAGYLLPVQYQEGVIREHMAVRETCGMFDVSHMGEVLFTGPSALQTLEHLLTNVYSDMPVGKVRYGVMCKEDGGCIDDLIVYKFGEEEYFVVVNASNREKDVAHMKEHLLPGTTMVDLSDGIAEIALQGPAAKAILTKLVPEDKLPQKYYTAVKEVMIDGKISAMISRTGYTGELGYEIYVDNDKAVALWEMLREAGKEEGLIPCGLGARDTLRLEAAMPLYGHEMDETISPLEAGLDLGVRMEKTDFIGKAGIEERGRNRERIGLVVTGRGIIREHEDLYLGEEKIGHTTSGTHAPYLKKAIAMALVETGRVKEGDIVEADVRGRRVAAEVVRLPFYTKKK